MDGVTRPSIEDGNDYMYGDAAYTESPQVAWNTIAISMVVIAIISLITIVGVLVCMKKLTCAHITCGKK